MDRNSVTDNAERQSFERGRFKKAWRAAAGFSAALLFGATSFSALADIKGHLSGVHDYNPQYQVACEGPGPAYDWGIVRKSEVNDTLTDTYDITYYLNSRYDAGVFHFGFWGPQDPEEWKFPTSYRGEVGPNGIPVWDMTVPNRTPVNLGRLREVGNAWVKFPDQPYPMAGMKLACDRTPYEQTSWRLLPTFRVYPRVVDDPEQTMNYRHPQYVHIIGLSDWITSSDNMIGRPERESVLRTDGNGELKWPVHAVTNEQTWADAFYKSSTGFPRSLIGRVGDSHYVHMWAYQGNKETGHKTMAVLALHVKEAWPQITLTDPGEITMGVGDAIPDRYRQATAIDFDGESVPVTFEMEPSTNAFRDIIYSAVSKHGQTNTLRRKVKI